MITEHDVAPVGKVNKTHGVKGELSMSLDTPELADSVRVGSCLVMDVDGILTPFFVSDVRPRGCESLLVTIDGLNSQEAAQAYVGHILYMPVTDMPRPLSNPETQEGFYASDLIGYLAYDDENHQIGEIIDIDDSTDNQLFIIQRDDEELLIPIADEFITGIDTHDRCLFLTLPTGLI